MNNPQLSALIGLFFSSRRAQIDSNNDPQQLDVIENVWYNQKRKLPLPWRVFVDRSQEELEKEIVIATQENRRLSSWKIFRVLARQFSESGALHWTLKALYPLLARNIELLIDGIISRHNLFEWMAGFCAGMALPSIRNHAFFQLQAEKMEDSTEATQNLPVVPKIFATGIRLGFMAGLYMVAPAAIPSIILELPVPENISSSSMLRIDIPSVALKMIQIYVAAQQGAFSAVRLHRSLAPPNQPEKEQQQGGYPQLPIDLTTPEARRQIQVFLPVYISDRTLESLILWGPIIWKEASRLYKIHFHFWPLRRWQRFKFRGSLCITTAEIASWIYFSRADEPQARPQ